MLDERSLFRREAGHFFREILDRRSWDLWALAILFPVTLHWAAASSHLLLEHVLAHQVEAYPWVLFLPFLIVVVWSYFVAKRLSRSRRLLDHPATRKDASALMLFLSPIGEADQPTVDEELGLVTDPTVRQKFKGSWRMPLEAIGYHLSRVDGLALKHVMVITSKKTVDDYARFEMLVKKLTLGVALDVQHVATLKDGAFRDGVDFLSPRALEDTIEYVYEFYRKKEIGEREVVVDITGGYKTTSIAGAIVALKENRRIQYVESAASYEVRFFDLEYETAHE